MSVDVTARRYRGAVVADGRTSTASLRRNRDFVLLEVGRLLSSGGSQLTTIAFLVWPELYVLIGYLIAITPDRILGRVASVRTTSRYFVGSLAAGFVLSSASARATVAVFTCCRPALAVWGTFSPSIRLAPSLDGLSS